VKGTHQRATSDPSYTTFLKNFGSFTVAKLDQKEVSGQEYILAELKAIQASIQALTHNHNLLSFASELASAGRGLVSLSGHLARTIVTLQRQAS
jgi:hypothetical protein